MPWNVALSEVSWLIIIATGPQIIKKTWSQNGRTIKIATTRGNQSSTHFLCKLEFTTK
jgi:hypothetical protein